MKTFTIVAVKDELTGTFLQPTFVESKEESIRLFTYQINNIKIWKDNPSDFSLYCLGSYDDETGKLTSDIVKIASGTSVVRREEKEKNDLLTNC